MKEWPVSHTRIACKNCVFVTKIYGLNTRSLQRGIAEAPQVQDLMFKMGKQQTETYQAPPKRFLPLAPIVHTVNMHHIVHVWKILSGGQKQKNRDAKQNFRRKTNKNPKIEENKIFSYHFHCTTNPLRRREIEELG